LAVQHHDESAGPGGHGAAHPASRSFSERFLIPLAIPIGAGIVIAAIILSVSQILLAVPEDVATPIALCIALIILLGCAYFATARRLSRGIITLGVAIPAIVLFGAGIGAGIYRQENPTTEHKGAEANAAPKPQITTDNKFSETSYTVYAGQQVTIDVENQGSNPHNMHILGVTNPDGSDIKTDILSAGNSAKLTFTIDKPGTYNFQCDVHPTEMKGTVTVNPGPPPGQPGPAAAGGLNEDATDNKFSSTSLTAKAGTAATLTLQNKGSNPHNWHLLDVKNADGSDIKTKILNPGETDSIQFTIDKPGTYNFQCDVHPAEMKGTLTVQ
jgi:plastocyanin